jgi:hypothetical protein
MIEGFLNFSSFFDRLVTACGLNNEEAKILWGAVGKDVSITSFHQSTLVILKKTLAAQVSRVSKGSLVDLFCRSVLISIQRLDFGEIKRLYEAFVF